MSLSSYNGHSNFTIKGKKFIKRGADNIYDIASVPAGGGSYESDWMDFPNHAGNFIYAEADITHNLGVEHPVIQIYVKGTESGNTSVYSVPMTLYEGSGIDQGWNYYPTSATQGKIRFYETLMIVEDESAGELGTKNMNQLQNLGAQFKVIASAGGGGGGFLYDFAVGQGSTTNKWGATTTWYSINSANIRKLDSSMPDITQADIMTARGASMQSGNPDRWSGGNSFATITINGVAYNMSCPFPGMGYILKGPVS